jgi:hypothetical protein
MSNSQIYLFVTFIASLVSICIFFRKFSDKVFEEKNLERNEYYFLAGLLLLFFPLTGIVFLISALLYAFFNFVWLIGYLTIHLFKR